MNNEETQEVQETSQTLTALLLAKRQGKPAMTREALKTALGFEPGMTDLVDAKWVRETEQGYVISSNGIIAEATLANRKYSI